MAKKNTKTKTVVLAGGSQVHLIWSFNFVWETSQNMSKLTSFLTQEIAVKIKILKYLLYEDICLFVCLFGDDTWQCWKEATFRVLIGGDLGNGGIKWDLSGAWVTIGCQVLNLCKWSKWSIMLRYFPFLNTIFKSVFAQYLFFLSWF